MNAGKHLPNTINILIKERNGKIKEFHYWPNEFGNYTCNIDFDSKFYLLISRDRGITKLNIGTILEKIYSVELISECIGNAQFLEDWSSLEHEEKVLQYTYDNFDGIVEFLYSPNGEQRLTALQERQEKEYIKSLKNKYRL
mgnify:CR=1 FL=1